LESLSPKEVLELVELAQKGDKASVERLLQVYDKKIKNIARSVIQYLVGQEFSDVVQDAKLTFWEAVLTYDLKRKTNFDYFIRNCIQKQLISKLKTITKCRNTPLNKGESLDAPTLDSEDPEKTNVYDTIADESIDVEKEVLLKQEADWLDKNLRKKLTELERETYDRYNQGYTYREIAIALQRTEKTIDNAIMRVRNKAKDIAKQYITNVLLKEEEIDIETILSMYRWEDIDDMVSSFSSKVFHLNEKIKKDQ
jgi:RNA polymerase sporulation-specific sigma factor